MRFCNYCRKPIPAGYDLWWKEKPYYPDCAVQVAATDTRKEEEMKEKTKDVERNCKYCKQHILATTQVVWKGNQYHELCLAQAIQEFHQPPKEEIENDDFNDEDFYSEDLEETEDFTGDELDVIEAQKPEGNGIIEPITMPPGSVIVAPRAIIHPPANGHSEQTKAGTLITHCGAKRINREELAGLPTPEATSTFKPIGHADLVEKIMDSLWYRRMTVVRDEYALSADGMKMFGLIELDIEYKGVRFAIGLRNSNDKSMRVAMVAGYKVTVCDNMMLQGDFQPMLAKHSKNFALEDSLAVACDRIQRNFGRLHNEINQKQETMIEPGFAKTILYNAFTEGKFPISLLRTVHREFFVEPSYKEFRQSTIWSLENAFTTGFKKLEPVSQFQYTARLGRFLSDYLKSVN